jgi:hypothetical protein
VAALAFAVTYAFESVGRQPAGAGPGAGVVVAPLAAGLRATVAAPLVVTGDALAHAVARQRAQQAAHARTLELHRLRDSSSVRAALRRMWLAGTIDRAHYLHARAVLWRAGQTALRLRGARANELYAALAMPAALARRRLLTSSRLRLVLLTVERNARFWALRRFPAAGQRITFAADPIVFQYEPGQGLQVHMLSTAGRVNGIARDCLYAHARCDRARTERALSRLSAVSSRRGGFVAWESLYRFGSGTPPWISAMTQGTAIQALARGAAALHERRWLLAARRALGAFERRAPLGVSAGRGSYLMYSFAPGVRILNGFLQSITGLHDLAVIAHSRRAARLFASGDRTARALLPSFDTGAWSLYLQGGHETDLNYHQLTAAFLRNLCRRTHAAAYCGEAQRLGIYERQPPRIDVVPLRALQTRQAVRIRFRLSKVSDVRVAVGGARGPVVLRQERMPRGGHALTWVPPRHGRYRLQIVATGLSGPRAVAVRNLLVQLPHQRHSQRTHAAPKT